MSAPAALRRSAEEGEMRDLIVPELRKQYPAARIVHELPLRYSTSRIDLAAILPTAIVGVEIKSSKDTLTRLRHQVESFAPICETVIVALAPCWNEQLPEITRTVNPKGYAGYRVTTRPRTEAQQIIHDIFARNVETWTVCHATKKVEVTAHGSEQRHPWYARMLHMLHVEELAGICSAHRIVYDRRPTHERMYSACADMMTGREIRAAVCAALRAREGFAKESDAPVVGVAA